MLERERAIDLLVKFLNSVLTSGTNASRITDEKMTDILQFYADLVDHALIIADSVKEPPASPVSPSSPSSAGTPVRAATPSQHLLIIVEFNPHCINNYNCCQTTSRRTRYQHLPTTCICTHQNSTSSHLKSILPLLFRCPGVLLDSSSTPVGVAGKLPKRILSRSA